MKRSLSKRLGGLLSYTLSRSTRFVDGTERLSAADHTHVLNAALSVDLGRGWIAGARGFYESGPPSVEAYDPMKEHRSPRDPDFYRLDLRIEKRWWWTRARWISLVAEVLNVTAQAERHQGTEGGGRLLIPSLGVEGAF